MILTRFHGHEVIIQNTIFPNIDFQCMARFVKNDRVAFTCVVSIKGRSSKSNLKAVYDLKTCHVWKLKLSSSFHPTTACNNSTSHFLHIYQVSTILILCTRTQFPVVLAYVIHIMYIANMGISKIVVKTGPYFWKSVCGLSNWR